MTTVDLRVRASTYGKDPTELAARALEYTPGERARRGLRAFLPFFGAGCAMLILPPHVLWLAIWTTVGVVRGRKTFRQERQFLSLAGSCPDCGRTAELEPPDSLPAIQRCDGCGAFLKLEPSRPSEA